MSTNENHESLWAALPSVKAAFAVADPLHRSVFSEGGVRDILWNGNSDMLKALDRPRTVQDEVHHWKRFSVSE
jgi:hypothetical protein